MGLPDPEGPAGPTGPQGPTAMDHAGVEFSEIGASSNIPETPQNLGSITLSCPSDGYVIFTTTASVITFGARTNCSLGLGTTAGGFELHSIRVGLLDGTDTIRRRFSPTSTAVVQVSAGDNTFFATAQKSTVFNAQTVNLDGIYLTGIFVPNRY